MNCTNSVIDFFIYFSAWPVHHQLDWAFAKEIQSRTAAHRERIRIYNCTHNGDLPCAIRRDFVPNNDEYKQKVFGLCHATYDAYFGDFDQAFNISIDRKVIRRLTELTDGFQETDYSIFRFNRRCK